MLSPWPHAGCKDGRRRSARRLGAAALAAAGCARACVPKPLALPSCACSGLRAAAPCRRLADPARNDWAPLRHAQPVKETGTKEMGLVIPVGRHSASHRIALVAFTVGAGPDLRDHSAQLSHSRSAASRATVVAVVGSGLPAAAGHTRETGAEQYQPLDGKRSRRLHEVGVRACTGVRA